MNNENGTLLNTGSTYSPADLITEIFTYHDHSNKIPHYESIRNGAMMFARIILAHTPKCADQSAAIRKVREAVMTANAAIALDGKV